MVFGTTWYIFDCKTGRGQSGRLEDLANLIIKSIDNTMDEDILSNLLSQYIISNNSIFQLFPFGFGLSYTTFEYSDLSISPLEVSMNSSVTIQVNIQNVGTVASSEVVQLYIADDLASVWIVIKNGVDEIGCAV